MLPDQRRELQKDWFLFFAKGGHLRLLRSLCDALDEVDWIIDEWAVALALVYLAELKLPISSTIHYLEDKLVAGREGKELEELLERYFGRKDKKDFSSVGARYVKLVDVFCYKAFTDWQQESSDLPFVRSISSVDALREYERDRLDTARHRYGLQMPSMNSYIAWLAWKNRSERMEEKTIKVINTIFILLVWAVQDENIASIISLIDDLRFFEDHLAKHSGWVADALYIEIDRKLVRYGDLKLVESVLEATGRDLDDIDVHVLCGDVELYKELIKHDASTNHLTGGIGCMEPQEWLDYINAFELDETRKIYLITETIKVAVEEGYTYFAREIAKELE